LAGAFTAAFLAAGLGVVALAAFAAAFFAAGGVGFAAGLGEGASENIGPPLALGLDAPKAACLAENPSSSACSSIGP
jgi:hypothetical protein